MLKKKILFTIILFLFSGLMANAQKTSISCSQIPTLIYLLDKYQYDPVAMDEAVSDSIRESFLQNLDPSRLYFTREDIASLKRFNLDFSDESDEDNCKFLEAATKLYRKKLVHADSLISQITSKPINLCEKDSLLLVNKGSNWFAADERQFIKRWQGWLKYKMLDYIFQSADETNDPLKDTRETLLGREEATRVKAGKKEKQKISRILNNPQGFENIVAAVLFKAVACRYDAHSDFFSPAEKQQFESLLSTTSDLFGFLLIENDDGQVVIEHIIPGSAAWKSNKLHKGDQIIKIKFPGNKTQDLSTSDYEEVRSVIAAGTDEAEFTVKKPNGQLKKVRLKKEKFEADEPLIKSYILKGKQTVGYISLPDFYTDFTRETAKNCANDMAKEIIKLQKENITGLIIDLRYNGGGLMEEAVDLAGIFINEGPISLLKGKQSNASTIKDMNRGTIYNGPLLIMINGLSASASELLAGVLQDYNRAILAGSPTFGKATAQMIFPMDESFDPASSNYKMPKEKGFLKITIEKFYRVNGKSHQLKGIIPDVTLPPFFYELGYKESQLPYALPQDSVPKKVNYQPLPPIPVKDLASKSCERISSDKNFKTIEYLGDSIRSVQKKDMFYPLEIEEFRKKKITEDVFYDMMDSLAYRPSSDFVVANNQFDREIMEMDSYRRETNETYLENIQEDIYIEECYRILNDFMNSINRTK